MSDLKSHTLNALRDSLPDLVKYNNGPFGALVIYGGQICSS